MQIRQDLLELPGHINIKIKISLASQNTYSNIWTHATVYHSNHHVQSNELDKIEGAGNGNIVIRDFDFLYTYHVQT